MQQIFISYSSADEEYAMRVYRFLKMNGLDSWFAPFCIGTGENFGEKIGNAINPAADQDDEGFSQRLDALTQARAVILILSRNSMNSVWVKKEIKFACKTKMKIIPIQIDNERLTPEFDFMLVDVQIKKAYHLPVAILEEVEQELRAFLKKEEPEYIENLELFTYNELKMETVARGDPYYVCGETLRVGLTKMHFYLSPPEELLSMASGNWAQDHFASTDVVFDGTLDAVCSQIPVADLRERIENSRRKVFLQFLRQENGCYYNNKKYGVYSIRPYGRTEDLSEVPLLEFEMYTTDYFTHRIMKDVCKQLVAEDDSYITKELNYLEMDVNRIFFTSLGINLLLQESSYRKNPSVLITSRSTNAAETYNRHQFSLSVIEGISLSDYDPYLQNINITSAVLRGLDEELGIQAHAVQLNTLRFYEFFVNRRNLEMGLACSIELDRKLSLSGDIMRLCGKDEIIEVAEKRVLSIEELKQFIFANRASFLPQAMFTILAYFASMGISYIDRRYFVAKEESFFLMGKQGDAEISGDAVFRGANYMAVIDGATPKGNRLWDGKRGDHFVAQLLADAVGELPVNATATEAVTLLNNRISLAYEQNGISFAELLPEEQLQASVIIYSASRHEVWSFGDCKLRINEVNHCHTKKVDQLMSDLRAFCVEIGRLDHTVDTERQGDYGRQQILPYLKKQALLANNPNASFGYDVLNGGKIRPEHVKVYAVQKGDHVVLASDGYPRLFDTLQETENYLFGQLKVDRDCLYSLRGTKGVAEGCQSFDDRCYLSFVVR